MYAIISAHNRKVLSEKRVDDDVRCNCQPANKPSCPVPGKCCSNKVIYQATVHHTNGSSAEYVGMTEPPFKLRYGNHKKSFQHEKYKSETTLSSYVWDQGLNPTPNISWRFLKTCSVYETGRRHCDLCLSEKEFIIRNMNKQNSINKRTDIGNRCPHRRRRTLEFYHEWTCAVGVVRCLSLSSLTQEALLLHCGSAPWTDVWEWLHIRPGPEETLGLKVN